jgi:uncharacterized protein
MDDQDQTAPAPAADQMNLRDIPVLLFVRGLAFMTVMVGLTGSLHFYLGARLIRDAGAPAPLATVEWAGLWLMYASIFGGFIGGRLLPRPFSQWLQWVGFSWMGTFGVLLAAVATSDLVLAVARLVTPITPAWEVGRAVAVAAVVVPALVWGFFTARRPMVRRITVDIPGLAPAFDGFKLVQLSDIHIGETLDRRFSALLRDMVNGLDADAVAITGDMVDGSVTRLRPEVAALGEFTSRFGTFFVTGNHEYYSGATQWMAECERLGMTVLHNSHRVLERDGAQLVLGGVPDLQGAGFSESHRPDVDLAFANTPVGVPRVLLAHQPRFATAARHAKVALMLSGHTHGGQIFPFNAFVRLQQPVVNGFHVIDGVPTWTSNGTGYWGPPFRVGPRGEITLISLRAVAA